MIAQSVGNISHIGLVITPISEHIKERPTTYAAGPVSENTKKNSQLADISDIL